MIKILHFSDLHLGVESYGRVDPDTGLSSRLADFLAAFDQVVDYALGNSVDLVLFCGDAYKSRNPTQTQQREFARRIAKLTSSGIPVFLVVGNHDLPNAVGRATAVDIFDTLEVQRLTVASRPGIHRIETRGGPVQIVALPWLRRSALLARDENKNLGLDELNQKLSQTLAGVVQDMAGKLDPAVPAILAAHVYVLGAKVGSEKTMTLGWEHCMLPSDLSGGIDYVALGHIHKHQTMNQNPPVVYSGSLERIDFSEEAEDKGFCLVQIEGKGKVSWEFHRVEARPFLTIKVDVPLDELDPTAAVLREIARTVKPTEGAVVRVMVSLTESGVTGAARLDEAQIRHALKDAYFVTISKEVARLQRSRLGSLQVEKLTPLDALRAYLEARSVPAERSRFLLERGERLLRPECGL